jgi:hypothetical protein
MKRINTKRIVDYVEPPTHTYLDSIFWDKDSHHSEINEVHLFNLLVEMIDKINELVEKTNNISERNNITVKVDTNQNGAVVESKSGKDIEG